MRKSPKSRTVKVDCKIVVGGHKNVDSQVKLLVPNEQRIVDVPLDNVRLRLVLHLRPLLDIPDVSKQENSLPLALPNRFHNPHRLFPFLGPLKFLVENRVLTRQVISQRQISELLRLFRLPLFL